MEKQIYCPITSQIFADPVVAEDGICYERSAILKWFESNSTSPTTRKQISKNLYDCIIVRNIVLDHLKAHPDLTDEQFVITKYDVGAGQQLTTAVKNSHYHQVREILSKNLYQIDPLISIENRFLIHIIWRYGLESDKLRSITDGNLDLNLPDTEGFTILHQQIIHESPQLLHALISAKVDLNCKTVYGSTPLILAIKNFKFANAKILLEAGADYREKIISPTLQFFDASTYKLRNLHQTINMIIHNIAIHYVDLFSYFIDNKYDLTNIEQLLHCVCLSNNLSNVKALLDYMPELLNSVDPQQCTALMMCSKYCVDSEIIDELLDRNIDLNTTDINGNSILNYKFSQRHFTRILSLIQPTLIRSVNSKKKSALHFFFNNDYVDLLLDAGIDATLCDINGSSVLFYVRNVKAFCSLVKAGADPLVFNNRSESCLYYACKNNRSELVKYILDNVNIDINAKCKNNYTVLHIACKYQNASIVELLLNYGADVNAIGPNKQQCIHIVCGVNWRIFNLLIDNNADLEHVDDTGSSPLHLAVKSSNIYYLRKLCQKPINVNKYTSQGDTAMHIILKNNFTWEYFFTLVSKGADLTLTDATDKTPMDICIKHNIKDVIYYLSTSGLFNARHIFDLIDLKSSASLDSIWCNCDNLDVETRNSQGDTPLIYACRNNSVTYTQFLINIGADPNAVNNSNNNILFIIAKNPRLHKNFYTIIKNLHKNNKNFNIDVTFDHNIRAIHLACEFNPEFAMLLIDIGADVTAVTTSGDTVKTLAQRSHYQPLINRLSTI